MRSRHGMLCLVVIAGVATIHAGLAQTASGSWSTVAPMPTARCCLAAVTGRDGRIYAIGGYSTRDSALNTVEAYDPATNAWSTLAPMPTPRLSLSAAIGRDRRIYAIGGDNPHGQFFNTVEAYTPATNTWSTVASLPTARAFTATVTGPDGRIYVIGGDNGSGALKTVDAYDPATNSWSEVASLPTPRETLAAATCPDGRIYAIGGANQGVPFPNIPLNTVEAYTPATNTWSTVASLPTARWQLAAATSQDGHVYAIGGYITSGELPTSTMEAYDPATNTWSTVAPMPTALCCLAAATGSDGRIYTIGGDDANGHFLNTVEAYTLTLAETVTPTVVASSATATTVPTNSQAPTTTPGPLTVHVKLGKKNVRPGQVQSITVSTSPGAQVTIVLTFPNRRQIRHHGTVDAAGKLVWHLKEPRGTVQGRDRTVRVGVTVQDESGRTARATGQYSTR